MINYGYDINEKDGDGNTLLDYACWRGNLPMIDLLIDKGMKLSMRDCLPLLNMAVMNKNTEMFDDCINIFKGIAQVPGNDLGELVNVINGLNSTFKGEFEMVYGIIQSFLRQHLLLFPRVQDGVGALLSCGDGGSVGFACDDGNRMVKCSGLTCYLRFRASVLIS